MLQKLIKYKKNVFVTFKKDPERYTEIQDKVGLLHQGKSTFS